MMPQQQIPGWLTNSASALESTVGEKHTMGMLHFEWYQEHFKTRYRVIFPPGWTESITLDEADYLEMEIEDWLDDFDLKIKERRSMKNNVESYTEWMTTEIAIAFKLKYYRYFAR